MDTFDHVIETTPLMAFADELVGQATGSSRGKWALVLVAFVAGVAVTAWFVRRKARAAHAAPPERADAPA